MVASVAWAPAAVAATSAIDGDRRYTSAASIAISAAPETAIPAVAAAIAAASLTPSPTITTVPRVRAVWTAATLSSGETWPWQCDHGTPRAVPTWRTTR